MQNRVLRCAITALTGIGLASATGACSMGEKMDEHCPTCAHGDAGTNPAPTNPNPGMPGATVDAGGGGGGVPANPPPTSSTGRCEGDRWTPNEPPSRELLGEYAAVKDLCGSALAEKLCEMVRASFRVKSYTEARRLVMRDVDIHEGRVQGVYDGLWHEPGMSEINIEHTWPQSRGAEGDAKSDMHHLFTTRSDYNSARGNLPLGEVASHSWPTTLLGDPDCTPQFAGDEGCFSMKGRDEAGVTVFEPRDAQKGNAARAIFYFAIRYGASCSRVKPLRDFDPSHADVTEAVLKRWNALDPPDDHERRRNDRVEAVQGIRNPFIDAPDLIERISFQ